MSLSFSANIAQRQALTVQRQAPRQARQALVVENRVVLRFMRFGRRYEPVYRIVAVDSKKARDTRPLEFVGSYNPFTKETNLNAPAIKVCINAAKARHIVESFHHSAWNPGLCASVGR